MSEPTVGPTDSLDSRILAFLTTNGPSKAKGIAKALAAETKEVNSALYGRLKGRVECDALYRWSLRSAGLPTPPAPGLQPDGPLRKLSRYYLECLAEGDGGEVSVWARSSFDKLDYAPVGALPGADHIRSALEGDAARALIGRCRRPNNRLALKLGMPVLVVEKKGKKGSFSKVEPLLLWTLDKNDPASGLVGQGDLPSLNPAAVRSLTGADQLLEEVLVLTRELGLDQDGSDAPEPVEILLRLRDLRPDWPWAEPTDIDHVPIDPALASVVGTGIYNRVVLVGTEESPYTRGLREELDRLTATALPSGCALSGWIHRRFDSASAATEPLVELLPLNSEQRRAVQRAMSEPITVITGPPGTGKSQVVSSILVNATYRGQRVLFASKNHQAVDVVESRVNALSDRPVLLRLGGDKDQKGRLRQYLTSLLAATADAGQRRAFDEAQSKVGGLRGRLEAIASEREAIVALRNTVDNAEQAAEKARQALGAASFGKAEGADCAAAASQLRKCRVAQRSGDRLAQSLVTRIFWPLLRGKRLERLGQELEALRSFRPIAGTPDSLSSWLAVRLPTSVRDEREVQAVGAGLHRLEQRLSLAETACRYLKALRSLTAHKSLEDLASAERDLQEQIEGASLELWKNWAALKPAELTPAERRLLSEYTTVLDLLVRADDEGDKAEGSLWRKYYELSEEAVSFLSCWAVTSLSAKGRVPFAPGLFDVVVIDEASQCDIASALPLLYRAKRAVIIGDPMQLKHITALSSKRDHQLLEKHGLAQEFLTWSYSSKSLYDLAASLVSSPDVAMLLDHHRSHPDVIGFSNREFYGGQLRIATRLNRLRSAFRSGPMVRWVDIRGDAVRPPGGGLVNAAEAAAVVKELRRLALEQGYRGSIGVTSPFRAHVNRVRDLVQQDRELDAALERLDFTVDSVHRFQGDERDLMVFSPAVSGGDTARALGFLGSQPNVFNVAVTRARSALIVIGDARAAAASGVPFFQKFRTYVTDLEKAVDSPRTEWGDLGAEYPRVSNPHQVSDWEKVLYRALYRAGVRTLPQYGEEKYILDLALIDGDRRLDIEVDGEAYHRAWDGELLRRDQMRSMRLNELGWDVMRFWVYQVRDDLDACVQRVRGWQGQGRSGSLGVEERETPSRSA